MSTLAEDLQLYLVINTYDVIIGFSLGGTLLPKRKKPLSYSSTLPSRFQRGPKKKEI